MSAELDQKFSGFQIKRELTLGDALTPISVLIAGVALWLTWLHDADLRRKQYADQIRHSASIVTAKIERWSPLADRYFQDIQPTIVDVSEKVAVDHTREPANRMLYKGLEQAEATASQRIVDEQLEVAYIELYGYVPSLQKTFDSTIQEMKKLETDAEDDTNQSLQQDLSNEGTLRLPTSVEIGNILRGDAEGRRQKLRLQIEAKATPLREQMLRLIHLSDEDILDEKKREAAMQGTTN